MKMTRNEYKKYVQKCVGRVFDPNDSYSWADYKKLDEDVEIIPLDLSAYPDIALEIKEKINKWFDEETTDKNSNYMLRGFTGSDNYGLAYKEGQELGMEVRNPSSYSWYGYNDLEMMIWTWCEGDTTLTLFNDRTKYEDNKKEIIKWYKEEFAV